MSDARLIGPGFSFKGESHAKGDTSLYSVSWCRVFGRHVHCGPRAWPVRISATFGVRVSGRPQDSISCGGGGFATRIGLLDNIFPGGNPPFQPFVTVAAEAGNFNSLVDDPGPGIELERSNAFDDHYVEPETKDTHKVELEFDCSTGASAKFDTVDSLRRQPRSEQLESVRYQSACGRSFAGKPRQEPQLPQTISRIRSHSARTEQRKCEIRCA